MGERTAQSATVDVLTAEVRVLMVGSRQVTLSVYKQLDTVHYDDLVPFGRVNDGNLRYYGRESIAVVGSDGRGVLVRARLDRRNEKGRISYFDEAWEHRRGLCTESEWAEAEALPLIVLAGLR